MQVSTDYVGREVKRFKDFLGNHTDSDIKKAVPLNTRIFRFLCWPKCFVRFGLIRERNLVWGRTP